MMQRLNDPAWASLSLLLALVCSAHAQTPEGWYRKVVTKDDVRLEVFEKGQGTHVSRRPHPKEGTNEVESTRGLPSDLALPQL